jgi:hypothetical protein
VIRYDPIGGVYSVFFSGGGAGVPVGSQVDAAFLNGGDTADLILSFDVPTTIGATTYDPADLVRWAGGSFSLFFDASAAGPGIGTETDVTGADRRGTLDVITFDIPTTIAPPTYLPGELVSWNGGAFASFYLDPLWPIESRVDAMSFLPDPGSVPPTMTVVKSTITAGDLTLSWSPATSVGGEDYGIYEGTIGSFYSHTSIDCTDNGGDLTEEVTPSAGDRYYLVVPLNPNDEGSYGKDSGPSERPVGNPGRCRPTQALACP